MAEIEITLPTVTYGNVKVKGTPEEFGISSLADAAELGVATAVYLNAFSQGWKIGAGIDVQVSAEQVGVTPDAAHEAAVEAIKTLSATEVDEQDPEGPGQAPWDSSAPAVDTVKKPWENGSAAPAKPAAINW